MQTAIRGHTNPDGTIAFTDFNHNEANSLGNAVVTSPDPLGAMGHSPSRLRHWDQEDSGDVVIDDRLFRPLFCGEFDVKPAFVIDDVMELIVDPPVFENWLS